MTDFRPSPALLAAVTEALATLKRHHGAQMRLALDITPDGQEFTADYCRAMVGVETLAIVPAAQSWIDRGERFAPKPGELAKVARELQRSMFGTTAGDATMTRYAGPVLREFSEDEQRANKIMRDIATRVGSYTLAMEAWASVLLAARHEDQRMAFNQGHVPPYIVDEAVLKVRKAHGLPEAA